MHTNLKISLHLHALLASLSVYLGLISSGHSAPTPATPADVFVGSTAVATHWRFNNIYQSYEQLSENLIDSGIRYNRDTGADRRFIAKIQKLSDAGVRSIITLHPGSGTRPNSSYWAVSPALNIDTYATLVGRDTLAFAEMNNELDGASQQAATYWQSAPAEQLSGDSSSPYYYVDYLHAATADTWRQLAASSDPAIYSLPLIGPSLTSDVAYATVGDQSSDIEYSNVHHYFYGWNPEVTNIRGIAQAKTYRSLVQSPTKGMIATEGGGATAASLPSTWPLIAHGRYLPRYYLAHFLAGYAVTTAYELVDQGTDPANQEQNFGLLKSDLSEKPGFTALKNILSVLKDPGPAFTAGSLDYTLAGSTSDVWSALFQKRNGDFYLCLWLGLPSYDPVTASSLTISAQSVSIALPAAIVDAQLFTVDDTGAMTSNAATIVSNAVTLAITDRVTIVRLSNVAGACAASTPSGLRAVTDSGQVIVKWSPVFEATSYTLKRAASSTGTYGVIATGLTSPTYTDTGRTNGMTYYYAVEATRSGGTSAAAKPISATPLAPIILDNAAASGVALTGSWTVSTSTAGYYGGNFLHDGNTGSTGGKQVEFSPSIATAGSYEVYTRWPTNTNRASNTPIEIVDLDGTHTLAINQKLTYDTWTFLGTYTFSAGAAGKIRIKNDGANGYVIADAVRLQLTRPRPPVGLTATASTGSVALTWTARTGATSYTIRRAATFDGPWTILATGVTGTSYTDLTVASSTRYFYTVTTIQAGGESVASYQIDVLVL